MGHFNIEGADRNTGQERIVSLLAEDEQDARRQAQRMNMLVSGIYPAIAANADSPKGAMSPAKGQSELDQAALAFYREARRLVRYVIIILGLLFIYWGLTGGGPLSELFHH